MSEILVIAIDGPAASGKGTLARKIAKHYGLAYLDTGLLYRAVGSAVLRTHADPTDEEVAVAAVIGISPARLDDPNLRSSEVGRAASVVAAMPAVRAALLDYQRRFAQEPPADKKGAVLDGRDIGTVVCPGATVKFFVTADPEVRAHRRYLELRRAGAQITEAEVLADIRERDARDAGRTTAPMVVAPGAYLLDTSNLSIEAAFAVARAFIDGHLDNSPA